MTSQLPSTRRPEPVPFRIGQGWDVHALVPGRRLILGGVLIPYDQGLLGHSDADALLHALIDALLGAAGLGDIGQHFSDQDPQFHDADSAALLRQIDQKLRQADWRIGNVDATIIAQAPRLASHLPAMQARIAELLELEITQVNVKAKTAERIGPIGRGEAIEVQAVALIYR